VDESSAVRGPPESESGQSRRFCDVSATSAIPPIAAVKRTRGTSHLSGGRSTRIRYDMFSSDQEPNSHRTLSFYLDYASFFEVKPLRELVTGLGRDLNFPRFAGRFHARGDVHGVTPYIVEELARANDTGHDGARCNADADRYGATLWIDKASQSLTHIE